MTMAIRSHCLDYSILHTMIAFDETIFSLLVVSVWLLFFSPSPFSLFNSTLPFNLRFASAKYYRETECVYTQVLYTRDISWSFLLLLLFSLSWSSPDINSVVKKFAFHFVKTQNGIRPKYRANIPNTKSHSRDAEHCRKENCAGKMKVNGPGCVVCVRFRLRS